MSDRGNRIRGHLAMLAFTVLVAGSFSLGAMIANEISPLALNAVRFFTASLLLGALVLLTGGVPRSALKAPWRYFLLGALFSVYFVLMFEGLKSAPPVSAAAVFTLVPLMAAGFGWLLMRQITTPRMALALAIGGLGALWVIFRADPLALLALDLGRGEAVYIVGCVAHALFTPMLRMVNRGERSLVYSFLFTTAGFVFLACLGWGSVLATDWTALSWLVWATVLYLSVFATAGSFFMLQYAALVLPAAKVMAYTYLTPAWVTCWELALGHDAPSPLVLCGVVLTLVALALLVKDEETT